MGISYNLTTSVSILLFPAEGEDIMLFLYLGLSTTSNLPPFQGSAGRVGKCEELPLLSTLHSCTYLCDKTRNKTGISRVAYTTTTTHTEDFENSQ